MLTRALYASIRGPTIARRPRARGRRGRPCWRRSPTGGGMITGIDPVRLGKAPISSPRRALGHLVGNGVRFGPRTGPMLLAGEGIESVLSLTDALPGVGMVAALSATHLPLLELRRVLLPRLMAQDNARPGRQAAERLRNRAEAAGISAHVLCPRLIDFNADL